MPGNQDISLWLDDAMPTGVYQFPVSLHGLFSVASAGTYTYYFLGIESSGSYTLNDTQFTLIYIPTSYGTVMPTLAGTGGSRDDSETRPGMTEADVNTERMESISANDARVRRELTEMRARMEKLEREMENNQR